MHYLNLIRRRTTGVFAQYRIGMRGHFHVELIHARTGLVKQTLDFDNLIVDAGLDKWVGGFGANTPWNTDAGVAVAVGTGSTPPAVSDIALESQLAYTTNNGGFSRVLTNANAVNNWTSSNTFTRLFGNEVANGNLTEVGVFLGPNPDSTLLCRSLFVDENGDPVTIVKTEEDQLRITYTISIQFSMDVNEQEDFLIVTPANPGGIPTLIRSRAGGVNLNGITIWTGTFNRFLGGWNNNACPAYAPNVMPGIGSNPGGDFLGNSTATDWMAYTPGTFYRDREVSWGASVGNDPGGIGLIAIRGVIDNINMYYTTFDPKVVKNDTERFVFQFRVHMGRLV